MIKQRKCNFNFNLFIFYHFELIIFLYLKMIEGIASLALTSQDYLMSQIPSSDMPNNLLNYPAIVKLDCILIKNFKSFSNILSQI